MENHPHSRVVRNSLNRERLRLRPSRRNRNLPNSNYQTPTDQILSFKLLIDAELLARDCDARQALFNPNRRTPHPDTIAETRREGIRHQLIATLQPEQLLGFQVRAAKLLD